MLNEIFSHPFSCMMVGPSQSGKSTLLKSILMNNTHLIKPAPQLITFCYSKYQEMYKELESLPITFHQGVPDFDTFDPSINNLVILDDLMEECEKDKSIVKLFTTDSHHNNISTFFIAHNLFSQGKYMRTISLQCHYLILLNNPRDRAQIYYLARQMYPTNPNFLIECYEDAVVNKTYGYLFLDLSQKTSNEYRVRTGILPLDEKIVYIMKN